MAAAIQRPHDPAACNAEGLDHFAAGDPHTAEVLLKAAYSGLPREPGILVNLGLALMQQGRVGEAERAYRLALQSNELRVRRSAAKNLGFLLLWCGHYADGWFWHRRRFEGEPFLQSQWQGEPLNGRTLTIWNDVGMGDAFQFVRYTLPLVQRGERIRWAVAESQIALFQQHLAWPLHEVVDRRLVDHLQDAPQIPLMSLIPLLDADLRWGRSFAAPTWRRPTADHADRIGLCWASNPQDRTMHAYKSCPPERLLSLQRRQHPDAPILSLQTDEAQAHQALGLQPAAPDWIATLKRISRCRQVISVDTAVAHLAAGSGVATTLLLADHPDWRWRPHPSVSSLWYPQIRAEPLVAPSAIRQQHA